MTAQETFLVFGLSLALGLLVGLQRERSGNALAGIRTFALITMLGTLAAVLAKVTSFWVIPAGGLGLAALFGVAFYSRQKQDVDHPLGLTTEVAALVMFLLGAYLVDGYRSVAIVMGGVVALLLYWKQSLHQFVQRMGDKDVHAVMQFVLIALVILPILPDKSYDPYNAVNVFEVWLVVVLVVGVSLGGYVVYKLVPPTTGSLLGGAIGGLISSTATTVAFARRSRANPECSPQAAQAIMIATVVSVVRVTVLLIIFAPAFALAMVPPLAALLGCMGLVTLGAWLLERKTKSDMPEQANPAELRPAVVFGLLYALVKFGTAWGKAKIGAAGLYLISAISGLTDVDAITLSMAGMTQQGGVQADQAWRVIVTAIGANLVFKYGCVVVLGSPGLRKQVGLLFALSEAAAAAIGLYWP